MASYITPIRRLLFSTSPDDSAKDHSPRADDSQRADDSADVLFIDDAPDKNIAKNRLSQFLTTGSLSTFLLLENSQTSSEPPKKKQGALSPIPTDFTDVQEEINKILNNPRPDSEVLLKAIFDSLESSRSETPVPSNLEFFLADNEKSNIKAVGLRNPSNYCFANALFQVLASFRPFNDDVLQKCSEKYKDIKFIKYLQGILQYLRSPKKTLQEPINVDFLQRFCKEGKEKLEAGYNKEAFIKICPNEIRNNQVPSIGQGDSIELLKYLFTGLRGFDQSKGNAISLAESNCIVEYTEVISCLYSDYKSQTEIRKQTGFVMPATRNKNYSIHDFLNEKEFITQAKHVQDYPETLCPRFKTEDDVKKEIIDHKGQYQKVDRDDFDNHTKQNIYTFPLATTGLFFEIKRNIYGAKSMCAITFPKVLNKDGMFSLCGFIVHQGSATGGHYVAYALRGTDWYYFNDNHNPVLLKHIDDLIKKDFIQRGVASIFYNRVLS